MIDKYFKQLPIQIDMFDVSTFDLTKKRSFNNTNDYSVINNPTYSDYLNNIFKELNPQSVMYAEFQKSWPHIDSDGAMCAINHYYVTQDAETVFYNKSNPDAELTFVKGETIPTLYKTADIVKETSFFAQSNSVWLLDVTKIHSIGFCGEPFNRTRTFIKWSFNQPYEEIYQRLFDEIIPKLNSTKKIDKV